MADKFKMTNSNTGNYYQIENGKRVFYNKAGKKIDQSAFLQAENAYIDDKGKLRLKDKVYTVSGSKSGRYYKIIDGKRHYYAADGTEINEKYFMEQEGVKKNEKGQFVKNSPVNNQQIQQKSAKQILNDLKKATKGLNDSKSIKAAIARIDNPEELKELERLLEAEGYKADDMYSAVEKFMYKELSDSSMFDNSFDYLEETVQKWIQNGTLQGQDANKAQARMAARVIRDGGDGAGTDCDEVTRGIAMIKAPKPTGNAEVDKANARRVLAEVERIIKNAHGETLEEYLRGEMLDGEVKELKASLAANKAMSDENNVQAVVDLVIKAVEGAGTNEDRLEAALESITSREERIAINKKLEEYCKQKGIKIDKKIGQDALQAILYDEVDTNTGLSTDHKKIRIYNEQLIKQGAYNEDEAVALRAQQAAKQAMEGDFENIMDAAENINDADVLKSMNQMLTTNKFKDFDDLMAKKGLSKTEQNLVNAKLASKNLLSDEKAAQVAYDLLNEKDYNSRAAGFEAIRKESVHKLVEEKLKQEGKSLEKILADFNKEKAERKEQSEIYDGLAFVSWGAEHKSDELRKNTDMSDTLYLESDEGVEVPAEKKAAYDAALAKLEGDLERIKEDYEAARLDQGLLSGFVNEVASRFNLGTTRDEIEARIEHDEETVRLLKLASEGKLTKMVDGRQVPVSFEEIFQERQSAVISANQASLSKLFGLEKPKEETKFDTDKVTAVSKQAEQIAAMNIAKDLVTDSWAELSNAIESKNADKLTAGIVSTMKNLETMTGQEMSLDSFGYEIKDGVIVDASGNAVPADKLAEVAGQLKNCVSDAAKAIYGKEIPADASAKDVSKLLEKGQEAKMEEFKEQYRAAFGQEPTDEMIEDYLTTISTGVTIINIAAAIGATILTAGYGSLAIFAAAGGTSMALNTLEHATDSNGLSLNELSRDAEQAMWDGALAAVGVKVGKFAEGFATSQKVLAKNAQILSKMGASDDIAQKAAHWVARVEAAGGEISSDTLQSLVQMYCMEGEFNEESFLRALIMSAGFNAAGHIAGGAKDVKLDGMKGADAASAPKAGDVEGARSADADGAEYRIELEGVKAQDTPVSQEFKSAMDDLETKVKSGKNNTVEELVESNPVFAQFKDELADIGDYRINFIDDAAGTTLGQHSKKNIALNFEALKENEEAFVNTLLHEAEHAKQHKRFYEIQFKSKAERTPAENRFYEAYKDMQKANKARADYYKNNKEVIDKFAKGEKLTAEEENIVLEYKKLYDEYRTNALEVNAREAGAKAAEQYNANKEVANGQETNEGTRGVQETDTAGHQDGAVGSAARDEASEGTTKGQEVNAETPEISSADRKFLTKPSKEELPENMEFTEDGEHLLVYDGDTVVKTYDYVDGKLHQINESIDNGRVETTFTDDGAAATRIEYDEAGNGSGFITIDGKRVNVGIYNVLDDNGNVIGANLFNAETNKPISTRIQSDDGGVIETKFNTDGKPVERTEFYENGAVKSKATMDPESEIVLTLDEYTPDGTKVNEAAFDPETGKGSGTMLDENGNPRSYEYDTNENFRWADEESPAAEAKADDAEVKPSVILDPNAVEPKPGFKFIDPKAVETNPKATIITDPNAIEPNSDARFIIDPNEVTTNPDAKIILDTTTPAEPNATPLIKPEPSAAPREVVKYDTDSTPGTPKADSEAAGVKPDDAETKPAEEAPKAEEGEAAEVKPDDAEDSLPDELPEPNDMPNIVVDTTDAGNGLSSRTSIQTAEIKDGKLVVDGEEFEIPRTIEEAEKLANGDRIRMYDYTDGSKDFDIRNNEGRIILTIKFDTNGKITSFEEFTFNDKGQITGSIYKDAEGNVTKAEEYTWDDKGNKASETYKDSKGNVINSKEYTWDDKGNNTSITHKDAEGNVTKAEEYTWDDKGNRTSTTYKDAEGNVTKAEEYTWDDKGNRTSTTYKDAEGQVTESYEYTYDNEGNRIRALNKEYDKKGRVKAQYIYDEVERSWVKDPDFKPEKHRFKIGEKTQAVIDRYKELKTKAEKQLKTLNDKFIEKRVKRRTTETDANGNTVEIAYLSGKNDNKRIETVKNPDGKTIEVRRFDSEGRLTSRKVSTDQYDLDIKYDKNGNETSFVRKIKNEDGQIVATEKSKDKGNHSFEYTNADGDNVNISFKDGEKVKSETFMGQSGVLKSETQYTPNGTVETVYPNGKQAGWNESTTVWKDKKGNLYRTQEKLENGNIYDNIKYDDGTEVKFTAANGSMSVTVLKQGENPVNYHYNSSDSVFEAFDNEGNVTHRGKFENGAWTELDKDGNTVKTYKHKDKKHHYTRNIISGTFVAGGVTGLGVLAYNNLNSDETEEDKPEVKPEVKPEDKPEDKPEVKPEDKQEDKPEVKPEDKPEDKPEVKPEGKPEDKPEVKPEGKPEDKPEVKPEGKPEGKPEDKPEVKPEGKPEDKPEVKPEGKPEDKPEVKPEDKPEVKPEGKPEDKPEVKPEVKPEDKPKEKREITSRERLELTQDINEAKTQEDIEKIYDELRTFKRFPGRKNIRKALRAKRRLFKAQEKQRSERVIERREEKYNKRIDKVRVDNYEQQLKEARENGIEIKDEYDFVKKPEDEFDQNNNYFA